MNKEKIINLNIGCGKGNTEGYFNYDKSYSIILSKFPIIIIKMIFFLRLIAKQHFDYACFIKKENIRYCDARKKIPHKDESVDNIYSSHTLEHLTYYDADRFLSECYRVLKVSGGIRIVIPNLRLFVEDYLKNKDADKFFDGLEIVQDSHIKNFSKFQFLFRKILNDGSHHNFMYDEESIKKKLLKNNFKSPKIVIPGQTTLKNLGKLNLMERSEEHNKSLYIEAYK